MSDPRTIPGLIEARAGADPDAPALLDLDRGPLVYRALYEHVANVTAELNALGIRRDDRVATILPNGAEAATAFLGIASAATCAPLNPAYREGELDFYIADLAPKALVVDPASEGPAREVARRRGIAVLELERVGRSAGSFRLASERAPAEPAGPADVALVLHTSGTTSRPKLVPLTHANLCASAANVAAVLRLGESDRCLNVMPLFHIHGLVAAVLASLRGGGSVVCTPGFHAPSFLSWLERHAPTWYTAVPTIHQAVAARAGSEVARRGRLRFARSSSAALPRQVAGELESALGVPVIESYGMTEAAHQIASNPLPPGERRPGSVGRAAGPQIAILDEAGNPLPPGTIGEVAIRGSNVFSGYVVSQDSNERSSSDGWFRTGDEGLLDEDGYLFLRGRLKEIINRGGEKVTPGEVEDALLAHPAVGQAVAFAVPDTRVGEEVGAAVVPRGGAAPGEEELQRFVAERLSDFKVPRWIAVVEEIPASPTGKLQRLGLAERLGIGTAPTRLRPARDGSAPTELERRLLSLWSEILDVVDLRVDDDFFAAGGDSLLAAELISRLREEGSEHLSLTTLVWAPTVATLAAEIENGARPRAAALVPLQTGGVRLPFFVVHALDGEVVRFGALGRELGPERPLYGLKALGVEKQQPVHGRIEAMAAHYLEEIRTVQEHGPYLFGALCMGAPIAIEMARALLAEGEEVAPLTLVDPHVPFHAEASPARRFARRAGRLLSTAGRPQAEPYATFPTPFLRQMARIRDAYVMTPYPAGVTVYVSDEHVELGWLSAVQGGATVHELGGTHMGLLRRPAVLRLAELIGAALEDAE